MATPNDPAVRNAWELMAGDVRPQPSPYSPVAARLLAARLMRLAQVGAQAVNANAEPMHRSKHQ